MTDVSISVANNFVHSCTAADQGYHAFGELARFVYCLLQKIKKASSLPLVEQCEEYVVPNHSRFPAIDDKSFLVGTRVMTALGKVGSHYLQTQFRRDARRFLQDFINCVLSTVAARSVIGQDLSCFCPAIVVGGDDVAPLQLFNKLLDGLLEKGWTRGSEVEACRAEYQSFVQEQRQLERSSTRSRPDVGDVLSFCSAPAGFRARRHLYKECIVVNQACGFHRFELSHPFLRLCVFRSSSWRRLRSVGLQRNVRSLPSVWIVSPSKRRKCVLSCFVCRTLFGARTSHRGNSSRKWACPCCLNLLLLLIALRQFLFLPHEVFLNLPLRARSLLICVPVGIGWCCFVALPRTQVSAGIMVAPLGVRQRQGQGWGYQTSLRRGALSTCRSLRLLLVLLGQAKSVLPPASGRERSPVVQWNCQGNLKSQVLQLVHQGVP